MLNQDLEKKLPVLASKRCSTDCVIQVLVTTHKANMLKWKPTMSLPPCWPNPFDHCLFQLLLDFDKIKFTFCACTIWFRILRGSDQEYMNVSVTIMKLNATFAVQIPGDSTIQYQGIVGPTTTAPRNSTKLVPKAVTILSRTCLMDNIV